MNGASCRSFFPKFTDIISGHAKKNAYLNRFKITDKPMCPCNEREQSVEHLIYVCSILEPKMSDMIKHIITRGWKCPLQTMKSLPYSMMQSHSLQANSFAASQEISRISRNPKVHYRSHKRPPTISIMRPPNPVHKTKSYFLEIHPNIIYPYVHRSPQWSLSLRFPHQNPIHPHFLKHTRHIPSPSHSSRFYHPHNIG